MSEEINEILNNIKRQNKWNDIDYFKTPLSTKDADKLLDYIEQLQQENQQLKERHYLIQGGRGNGKTLVLMLQKENNKYKSVLDEIREYIERFNIEYLHEIYEHNLAGTLEVIEEILDKVKE